MQDLHKALGDIKSIRRQMARSTEFRGYGPATLAGTAAIPIMAAGAQMVLLPDPASNITSYLRIWLSAATLSAALAGTQMYTPSRRIHSGTFSVGNGFSVWSGAVAGRGNFILCGAGR